MEIVRGFGSVARPAQFSITLTGAANLGQASTTATVFSVTGRVLVHVITAFCVAGLDEALATATISLGTINQVTQFSGAATNSVDIDTGEWWVTSGSLTVGAADASDANQAIFVSEDIILNFLSQNTDEGVLEVYALWEPLSTDATLT